MAAANSPRRAARRYNPRQSSKTMAIDLYWGSGSTYCWRVLLALKRKGLEYRSHLLKFDQQEHQAPQMLAMRPRGRLPVLRDGDYVVFESVAILYFLDRKYPEPPLFGRNAEEGGVIMRVVCEYQAYAEPSLMRLVAHFLYRRGGGRGGGPPPAPAPGPPPVSRAARHPPRPPSP